jgi:solute carrier family 35 protein F5
MSQEPLLCPTPEKPPLPLHLRLFGMFSLALVVLLWTVSNFSSVIVTKEYPHVFLVNMLYASGLQLYFVFLWVKDPIKALRSRYADSSSDSTSGDDEKQDEKPSQPFTVLEHAKIAILFSIFYLTGNMAMFYSFSTTSVSAASLMACTSSLWTLLFSRLLGLDRVSAMKVGSVVLTIGSVAYFNWHDFVAAESRAEMTLLGNGLGVLSAVFYGAYSTYLKWACRGDESRLSYALLFAFAGLYASIFVIPCSLALHYFGIDTLQLPSLRIVGLIVFNSIVGTVIPNYLWNAAFLFTSPLSVAIGLSFMTPLSLFGDWFFGSVLVQSYHIVATCIMMAGFLLINFADIYSKHDIPLF